MRAVLLVPMKIRGRTIGTISLVSAESGRTFDAGDVEFAEQIAERAALAVENARLYGERANIARTLQASLLPEALPELPGWELAAMYRPAAQEGEVGGDFYDMWEAGEDWLLLIGDVTGKGVRAATVTSLVRHTAWAASEFDPRPAAPARTRERRPAPPPVAVGVHCALPAHLRLSGRRSPRAAILCPGCSGTTASPRSATTARCSAPSPVRSGPKSSYALGSDESLVAITDGVTDTVGADDERFGQQRLREPFSRTRGAPRRRRSANAWSPRSNVSRSGRRPTTRRSSRCAAGRGRSGWAASRAPPSGR